LLMHFEREITALVNHEKFFDLRMLVQRDDNSAPARPDHILAPALNVFQKLREF